MHANVPPELLVPAVSPCRLRPPKVVPRQNSWIPQNENYKKASQPLRAPPRPLASPAKTVAFGRTATDKKTDSATRKEIDSIKKTLSEQGTQIKSLQDLLESRNAEQGAEIKALQDAFESRNAVQGAQIKALQDAFESRNAEQRAQIKALQDAFESRNAVRHAQIDKLTRLVETLANNQSAANNPAPSQSVQSKLVVDKSAPSKSTPRQSAKAGTSVTGVSFVEPNRRRKHKGTVALRNSGQSEKENVAPAANRSKRLPASINSLDGVSIVGQSVARLDARDLRSLDNLMERERDHDVYELMDKFVSISLEKRTVMGRKR